MITSAAKRIRLNECGTCCAHKFNLNAFRHEWSYSQYSRRAIDYYIYFIDENKRYNRLPETCWEVVSHSDWQTWISCQTEKKILPVQKKSPKKFSHFSLAFLECFTLVLAIGHLISPLGFIEVKVIQFLVFSVVQNCIYYVFYSVCLEFCCFDDLVL
jgi:hypothetical protein